jgi:hypothetical protein
VRITSDDQEPTDEPALTEQPSFIKGMHAECILQQKPLFEGGLDKGARRPKPNPEQGELFQ